MGFLYMFFGILQVIIATLMLVFGDKSTKISSVYAVILATLLFMASTGYVSHSPQNCNENIGTVAQQHPSQPSSGQVLKR